MGHKQSPSSSSDAPLPAAHVLVVGWVDVVEPQALHEAGHCSLTVDPCSASVQYATRSEHDMSFPLESVNDVEERSVHEDEPVEKEEACWLINSRAWLTNDVDGQHFET
jgi:hypothetical protein